MRAGSFAVAAAHAAPCFDCAAFLRSRLRAMAPADARSIPVEALQLPRTRRAFLSRRRGPADAESVSVEALRPPWMHRERFRLRAVIPTETG